MALLAILRMKLPRVYPILDAATLASRGTTLAEAAHALLDGGAQLLQLRNKQHWTRQVFAEAQSVAELCRAQQTPLIINDRADVALLLDAGVHVGQDDLEPKDVRKVVGRKCAIGFSTHNQDQLERAAKLPISYLAVGPLYPTASKANPDPVVGLDTLRRLRATTRKPLVAIGGITLDNAAETLQAGADSVAIIAALYTAPCTPTSIRERMEQWQRLTQN